MKLVYTHIRAEESYFFDVTPYNSVEFCRNSCIPGGNTNKNVGFLASKLCVSLDIVESSLPIEVDFVG
jgi:hypothetical protein